jgi:hypothetical protein
MCLVSETAFGEPAVAITTPVRLPPWTTPKQWMRVAWASAAAKDVWADRVQRVNHALQVLELESVYRGLRHSALVFKSPAELVALSQEALKRGCVAFPLNLEGASTYGYASGSTAYKEGQSFRFRTILTKDPAPWVAHSNNDELGIGELLGYPKCCSEFYKEVWVEGGWRDTTYPMALKGTDGPPEANILLRWMGPRFVRHLPCSFTCEATIELGRSNAALGEELGYKQEMAWMREMLSWNVEWSSMHGVAEIKTPVFKISTSTDPFANKVVVQKAGTSYPEEGATGLAFPFQQPSMLKITESKSFKSAFGLDREWLDNGFNSKTAMEEAHNWLLSIMPPMPSGMHILDLGCGNGLLLEKLCALSTDSVPHGIDIDPARVLRAAQRLHWGFFDAANISAMTWDKEYDLIVFMPGRLSEMKPEEAAAVLAKLNKSKRVLMYMYGDRIKDTVFPKLDDQFKLIAGLNEVTNVLAGLYVRGDYVL